MSTVNFTGAGQAGKWTDSKNWQGGLVPTTSSLALLFDVSSQTFTGPIAAGTIMLLGSESIGFNGVVTTTDAGYCSGIMVCTGATMTFNAGSTLNDDAGALLVGVGGVGTLTAYGTTQQTTTINSNNATMGKNTGAGVGTITIDGATWNCGAVAFVGFNGTGSLNVKDGGVVNIGGNLSVAGGDTSTGNVTVAAGSTVNVGGSCGLGSPRADQVAGGDGKITVQAGGTLNVGNWLFENSTSSLVLAGGNVNLGTRGLGWVVLNAGGTVSGYGKISSANSVFINNGSITAQGGTLELASTVSGTGQLNIAANSCAKLDGAAAQTSAIDFAGANGSLEFAQTPWVPGQINGFAAGDKIVFDTMVSSVKWAPTSGTLSVINGGQTVDTLHLGGVAAGALFSVQQSAGTSIITLHS